MTTTELTTPPRTCRPPESWSDSAPPTITGREDILPLVGLIPVAGPPVVLLAVPWLLFVLMLVGPFAVLFTLVVVLVAAAALVVLIGAILASPYLLVRHLIAHGRGLRPMARGARLGDAWHLQRQEAAR